MKKIVELVNAFTGYTLRKKVKHDPAGECSVIQLKDLSSEDFSSIQHTPFKTSFKDIPSQQVLKIGDILLLSKGTNNYALLYRDQFAPAVAVSSFTILRIKTDLVKPKFLTWYLNSMKAQEYFNAQRAGTTTLNLSKKAIEELEVPIPTIAMQEQMIALVQQYALYKKRLTEAEHQRKLLIDTILNNQLNNI